MKHIELKKIELTNYRNIKYASYEFDGNSKIIGENRIGKTNTLESICWLLSDKLLDGSSDVATIKPLSDTTLEVRVKGTFMVDEKEITIEKAYKENWVKTRGTTELEMKGHTTTYYYNGVKQSTVRAYNQLISADFGITQDATTKLDYTQMLTNPFYLGNLGESKDWTELRAFIIKLVGDVSDNDVINSKPELNIIKNDIELVSGRIDQLKKKYANDIDAIKTQIIGDESQIGMLEQTANPSDEELYIAKRKINECEDRIVELKNGNTIDTKSESIQKRINEKKLELAELEKQDLMNKTMNPERESLFNQIETTRAELYGLIDKRTDTTNEKRTAESQAEWARREAEDRQTTRAELIFKLRKIDAELKNPNIEIETECPVCHRPYEQEKLDELKAERTAKLLEEKDRILFEGKNNKTALDGYISSANDSELKAKALQSQIDAYNKQIETINKTLNDLKNKLDSMSNDVAMPSNPEIDKLKDEIEILTKDYYTSREEFSKGIQNINQAISDVEEEMKPFKEVMANRDYYNRQMATLTGVKASKDKHTRELADIEQKKEMLNTFIYTKLKMLDDNVSKVFGNIKFQLIKENINGGFDAICKPYIYDTVRNESTDTSWKSGSKSERVVTGIAITECIKKVLDLPNLPYLFDEGGEISTETFKNRFNTDSQIICVKIADNIMSPIVQKLC